MDRAIKKLLPPDPKDSRFWCVKKRWDPTAGAVLMVDAFIDQEFDKATKLHQHYLTWVKERNPARQVLEEQNGYDTKFAMHTLRLLYAGLEILTTGDLHTRRPEAPYLLEIRGGQYTLAQIIDHANELIAKIDSCTPVVPASVERGAINKKIVELTDGWFNRERPFEVNYAAA